MYALRTYFFLCNCFSALSLSPKVLFLLDFCFWPLVKYHIFDLFKQVDDVQLNLEKERAQVSALEKKQKKFDQVCK